MNDSSRFCCYLAGQPDHLTPERQIQAYWSDDLAGQPMVLSQRCRLTDGELPGEVAANRGLTDGFAATTNMAWVHDPVSDALQPFWLSPELYSRLSEMQNHEEPAPTFDLHSLNALAIAGILVPGRAAFPQKTIAAGRSQFADQVSRKGFAPVAGLIHPFHISALRRYYRHLIRTGKLPLGDTQSSRRYYAHNDSVARFFHLQLTSVVSMLFAEPVKPSYVYFASYQGGACLEKHIDRSQCDFSVSLCLDYSPEPACQTPWPLRLHTPRGLTTVYQSIGDALLYRGCQVPHSRGVLPRGHTSSSIFFHYVPVDFDGPLD